MRRLMIVSLGLFVMTPLGCGGSPSRPADAGRDTGVDSGGSDAGHDSGSAVDAGEDSGSAADAGEDAGGGSDAGMDAGGDAGSDAGTDAGGDAGSDAGTDASADAAIPPGMCTSDSSLCTPTCLRPITCVTECGGPEVNCGCCPCAEGSFDAISCGSGD